VGYQTEFTVQEVLKGDNTAKKFVLHHYERIGQDGWNSNTPDPFRIDFKPEVDRWYLLILKQEAEGRFAPIPRGGGETLSDGFPVIRLGIAPP